MSKQGLFAIENDGQTLIVTPKHDVGSLFEDSIQAEFGLVLDKLGQLGISGAIVDFCHVAYFGSSMLEGLLRIHKKVQAAGGRMILCNLTPIGRDVLHATRLDSTWTISKTKAEAMDELRKQPS